MGERPAAGSADLPDLLRDGPITLRRWRAADAEQLDRAVGESVGHLRPWASWVADEPLGIEKRRELIAGWERDAESGGDVVYGIFHGADVAGGAGLHHRAGPDALEIGYWVHPSYLRQGVATRAARLLSDAAFGLRTV